MFLSMPPRKNNQTFASDPCVMQQQLEGLKHKMTSIQHQLDHIIPLLINQPQHGTLGPQGTALSSDDEITMDNPFARLHGLRVNFQDTLNLFIPDSVSEAHQHALLIEQQLSRHFTGFFPLSGHSDRPISTIDSRTFPPPPPLTRPPQPLSTSLTRPGACFFCGEFVHRQATCPKLLGSQGLLLEEYPAEEYSSPPIYDEEPLPEELLHPDQGSCLVLHCTFLSPKQPPENPPSSIMSHQRRAVHANQNRFRDANNLLSNIKTSIPEFKGLHDPDAYLD
ncbi:hypothetical protein C2S52_006820 [Perilla frutescens var. hirtella]|nr:hypothetical protein C2S52_006820 [Perilla frutescens var. hirtella]